MQIPNARPNSNHSLWVLVAEFPLMDFLPNHDRSNGPAAGGLFQSLHKLGMSPECIENIATTLAGFIIETLGRTKQGKLEFSGWIRIFCQKQIFPDAGANMIGGWGYFMIERGEDLSPDSSVIPHNNIDLYLYREGEYSR